MAPEDLEGHHALVRGIMPIEHTPVMPDEVVRYLNCAPGKLYVDGTLGGGGHAIKILDATAPGGKVIGLDIDDYALSKAAGRLSRYGDRVAILRENYKDIKTVLKRLGIGTVDGVLLDLGVSSFELTSPERGFSFLYDSRLDMRMDRRGELTAREIVNHSPVEELERIFRLYGEEKKARAVAKAIDRERKKKPIETTFELARIVAHCLPASMRRFKIHPATRVFQALRIAVNEELPNLEAGIKEGFECLSQGGRMVVISFHSLEDRIVKHYFRLISSGCVCPREMPKCVCGHEPRARLLTKKALSPSDSEIEKNPRARSAKLRAIEKI